MSALAVLMAPIAALVSWAVTGWLRRYALRTGWLDRPNERSSHTVPTPRGGGVAIVLSFLMLASAWLGIGAASPALTGSLIGGAGLVAILGFVDDRRPLPARWRFLGHLAAAAWILAWLGPVPPAPIFGPVVDLGAAAWFVAGLFIVWSINQFNFMDGIDGIAGFEAICVASGGALLWWLVQPTGDWPVALAFAACVAGFLVWNYPPARIFMGDAGSGFLGCTVAIFALASSQATPRLFWSWLILVGVFMVDATVTLVRRVANGERFSEPHRSHAYQYASRLHGSHRTVTLAVVAIDIVWLLPIAAGVALDKIDGALGLCLAYAPLMILAFRYRAGRRDRQSV